MQAPTPHSTNQTQQGYTLWQGLPLKMWANCIPATKAPLTFRITKRTLEFDGTLPASDLKPTEMSEVNQEESFPPQNSFSTHRCYCLAARCQMPAGTKLALGKVPVALPLTPSSLHPFWVSPGPGVLPSQTHHRFSLLTCFSKLRATWTSSGWLQFLNFFAHLVLAQGFFVLKIN